VRINIQWADSSNLRVCLLSSLALHTTQRAHIVLALRGCGRVYVKKTPTRSDQPWKFGVFRKWKWAKNCTCLYTHPLPMFPWRRLVERACSRPLLYGNDSHKIVLLNVIRSVCCGIWLGPEFQNQRLRVRVYIRLQQARVRDFASAWVTVAAGTVESPSFFDSVKHGLSSSNVSAISQILCKRPGIHGISSFKKCESMQIPLGRETGGCY